MPMTTDRDLLMIEPGIFVLALDASTLLRNTLDGSVSGTSVTSASSNFATLLVDFGHVCTLHDVPCEVISRTSTTQLVVSLPRGSASDPLIDPASGSAQRVKVPTFRRLMDLAEAWVLGSLGIDPADPVNPLDAGAIMNPAAVKRLIALRTIQQAYGIAAANAPTTPSVKDRAALYVTLLDQAKRSTVALIDLNGDGLADVTRRVGVVQFVRQ